MKFDEIIMPAGVARKHMAFPIDKVNPLDLAIAKENANDTDVSDSISDKYIMSNVYPFAKKVSINASNAAISNNRQILSNNVLQMSGIRDAVTIASNANTWQVIKFKNIHYISDSSEYYIDLPNGIIYPKKTGYYRVNCTLKLDHVSEQDWTMYGLCAYELERTPTNVQWNNVYNSNNIISFVQTAKAATLNYNGFIQIGQVQNVGSFTGFRMFFGFSDRIAGSPAYNMTIPAESPIGNYTYNQYSYAALTCEYVCPLQEVDAPKYITGN
jgi:hypothetical protein